MHLSLLLAYSNLSLVLKTMDVLLVFLGALLIATACHRARLGRFADVCRTIVAGLCLSMTVPMADLLVRAGAGLGCSWQLASWQYGAEALLLFGGVMALIAGTLRSECKGQSLPSP